MGVYIKGMELPKDTEKVIVIVDTKDEREAYTFPKPKEDIVNIREPHGRLIDGDVLAKEMRESQQTSKVKIWTLLTKYAPTIIEGSE